MGQTFFTDNFFWIFMWKKYRKIQYSRLEQHQNAQNFCAHFAHTICIFSFTRKTFSLSLFCPKHKTSMRKLLRKQCIWILIDWNFTQIILSALATLLVYPATGTVIHRRRRATEGIKPLSIRSEKLKVFNIYAKNTQIVNNPSLS